MSGDLIASARRFDPEEPLDLHPDPVRQWLDWEQQANLTGFRTSTRPVQVSVASVPLREVEVHILPGATPALVTRFVRGDNVLVARHPLNQDPAVAWFGAPAVEHWTARFTSSRTLAFPGLDSGSALFSLKLATDHPHPDFHQPEKTRLLDEAVASVAWVRVLARINRLLGPLGDVALISEVLVVLEAGGESGFMVRDLGLFQDGHYYLPALSIPFVGRQIAARNGQPFESFWAEAFAFVVGRAKARLLARYGLWYDTPNPQNLLLQLDRELRPTGTLVFRDVGDGECATDAFSARDLPWTRLEHDVRPETATSFWAFGEAGEHSVPIDTLRAWYARHDAGYFAELGRWFPELAPREELGGPACLAHWNGALRGPQAAPAIAAAFARALRPRR